MTSAHRTIWNIDAQAQAQRNDDHDGDILPEPQSGVSLSDQEHDQRNDDARRHTVAQQANQQHADTEQNNEDYTLHFLPGPRRTSPGTRLYASAVCSGFGIGGAV